MRECQQKCVGYTECIQTASQKSDGLQTTGKIRRKPSIERWNYQFTEDWDQSSQ
jgi:hypothetical protein